MAELETVREMLERLGLGHNVGGAGGWVSVSPDAVAEVEAYVAARLEELRGRMLEEFLDWRSIEPGDACETCRGAGRRVYSSTATWRGGIGGQALTPGTCDACWGSGSRSRPGLDLRKLDDLRAQVVAVQEARTAARQEALADLARWFREDAANRADPTSIPLAVVLRRLGVEP